MVVARAINTGQNRPIMTMKILLSMLSILFVTHGSNVLAHPGGHFTTISDDQAMAIGAAAAEQLVDYDVGLGFGKLTASWKGLSRDATRVHARGEGYYIVSVANTYEGETMFVLMSLSGTVYDINFTGEFEGLQ